MTAKKRTKKITLKEFQAWLEGVEELQADGWCPNYEQWVLIREKIKHIKEETKVVNTVVEQVQVGGHAQFPVAPYIAPPPQVGGVPGAPVAMSPEAKQMLNGGPGAAATKTPDIDSSDGNVTSPFA